MMQSYLIIQEGLRGERIFTLESRANIGRGPENDIHLPDPSVSRKHAVVYFAQGKPIVEDLDSSNGIFVNDEKVKKAVLKSGDTLRVGKMTVQFLQEQEVKKQIYIEETQLFDITDIVSSPKEETQFLRSRRLVDAIANVPAFSGLSDEDIEQLCKGAKLVVLEEGKTIIRHGEWADCLYVVLDGRVRIFTYDHKGNDITLEYLSGNQFFGESVLFTGTPHTAMVQAVEETLLCKLNFEAVRGIIKEFPAVWGILEQYHHERVQKAQNKKKAVGFEKRGHPRYELKLAVNFSVSSGSDTPSQFQRKTFKTVCTDISNSGARLEIKDRSLLDLPVGCDLRLELALPKPKERIRCIGTVRHIIEARVEKETFYLGVEFSEILPEDRKKLEHFLYTSPTANIKKS